MLHAQLIGLAEKLLLVFSTKVVASHILFVAVHHMSKLCLILDIDHTLLHCTELQDFAGMQAFNGQHDFHVIYIHQKSHYIKLRPHLVTFLQRVQELFECYICTHGDAVYAAEVQKVLHVTLPTLSSSR